MTKTYAGQPGGIAARLMAIAERFAAMAASGAAIGACGAALALLGCGGGGPCKGAQCPATLTLLASPGSAGRIDSLLPAIEVRLTRDGQPIASAPIAVSAPLGVAIAPQSSTTDADGRALVMVTLPRTPGPVALQLSAEDAPPLALSVSSVAPAAGTILTAVNVTHLRNMPPPGLGGAGTALSIGGPQSLVVAADQTLYFSDEDENVVHALLPSGEAAPFAGTTAVGNAGDGGPALRATLNNPDGLALDEARHALYVVSNLDTVRRIDLQSGVITRYAGGGSATSAPFGDGGPATDATLSRAFNLSVGPDHALYIEDAARAVIRRVDGDTGVISSFLPVGPCSGSTPHLSACGQGCAMAWDSSGDLYVSGFVCDAPGIQYGGILQVVPATGGSSIAAGALSGSSADGQPAAATDIGHPVGLAFDGAGNLYFSTLEDSSGAAKHQVRRIDQVTGRVSTIAGVGPGGSSGDGGPAVSALLDGPFALAFDPEGNLYLSEILGFDLRVIWGAGSR